MPVLIDPSREQVVEKRDLDCGVPLDIGTQNEVVLTKFITTNPQKACFQPEGIWEEEVTVDIGGGKKSVRLGIKLPDGRVRGVNIDDGLIIRLTGTLTGLVGLLPGRPPMDESEVQAFVDQNDKSPPMYQRWDFRVTSVKRTNGPEERLKLHRSDDQKRLNSQSEMYEAVAAAFRQGAVVAPGESTSKLLKAGVDDLTLGPAQSSSGVVTKGERATAAAKAVAEGIKAE